MHYTGKKTTETNLFHNDEVTHLNVRALYLDSPCKGKVWVLERAGQAWGALVPSLPSTALWGQKWEMFPPQELGNAALGRLPVPPAPTGAPRKGWKPLLEQLQTPALAAQSPSHCLAITLQQLLKYLLVLLNSGIQKYFQHQADERARAQSYSREPSQPAPFPQVPEDVQLTLKPGWKHSGSIQNPGSFPALLQLQHLAQLCHLPFASCRTSQTRENKSYRNHVNIYSCAAVKHFPVALKQGINSTIG